MKKLISLVIIVVQIGTLQSCRQDDDPDMTVQEQYKKIDTNDLAKNTDSTVVNAINTQINEDYEDPPVKNGTHWRIKK
ncbi:hypothetical protein VUJ46_19945 [Chryseobacterium sp. MYb264]|uniref:hypothetical protein n=1 Tax=Chryseobacterium sp. MYb264 TaxID=2745153 RepID=UPI002E0E3B63|nr:hypothetical protein VUJ46_19945 [Chryseobacterium sp. MYb264]